MKKLTTVGFLVILLSLQTGSVWAKESDCWKKRAEAQLEACTKIIETMRLSGKRIDNANLSLMYGNRGNAYSDKGELDRAIADYDQAIKLNPKHAGAYYNRGIAYSNKSEADRAIADYDQAIKLNPKYAKAYYNRGIAYSNKSEADRAIADFRKYLEFDPSDNDAVAMLKKLGAKP